MTQREKILSIAVGGLLLILGFNYVFSSYRDALDTRRDRLSTLQSDVADKEQLALAGAMADAEISELRKRSLPSKPEIAQGFYQNWLLTVVDEVGLIGPNVDYLTTNPQGDLYRQYRFKVTGHGDLKQIAELIYRIQNEDFLHRLQKINIEKRSDEDPLTVVLDIDAVSLNDADPLKPPTGGPTPRVALPKEEYIGAIINRNPLSPPNQAPRFVADGPGEAYIGQDFRYVAKFDDPEGHYLQYELVGEAPDWIQLDSDSGELRGRPEEEGDYELTVRAIDSGLPPRKSERDVKLSVRQPPEEPAEEEPSFDEAEQTFLTALLQSGGQWQAWVKVRTSGETLRLNEGDEIKVGGAMGKVVEITYHHVVLETEDRRWTFRTNQSLADAFRAGQSD